MAATTFVARSGRCIVTDATDRLHMTNEPDIVATVRRRGLFHVEWEIRAWSRKKVLASGAARLKVSAKLEAIAAAHRPGILGGGR